MHKFETFASVEVLYGLSEGKKLIKYYAPFIFGLFNAKHLVSYIQFCPAHKKYAFVLMFLNECFFFLF